MKDLDWSKAPEGATHYGAGGGAWVASWYIVGKNTLAAMLDDGIDDEWDSREIDQEDRFALLPLLIARPTTPQWNGTGLPPVGVNVTLDACEHSVFDDYQVMIGTTVKVTAAFKSPVGVDMIACALPGGLCGCFRADMARPIRTPEQIAAEEREVAVKDMVDRFALYAHPDIQWHALFEQMYDCGCRMTAEDER